MELRLSLNRAASIARPGGSVKGVVGEISEFSTTNHTKNTNENGEINAINKNLKIRLLLWLGFIRVFRVIRG